MSRFFGVTDSESSSESSDSESEFFNGGGAGTGGKKSSVNPTSFLLSDDEEDVKRVVRSAKDKRYEALHALMKNIRNSKKIKDFNKMETYFQDLTKAYDKAKAVVLKEEGGVTPRFYVRILVEMEDLINETWEDREGRKNMNKNNSKSLSALRQRFRKYVRDFDDDMAKFRENPDAPDEDAEGKEGESQDSESDDEDDDRDKNMKKRMSREGSALSGDKTGDKPPSKKKVALTGDDDESDDSYWDDSDEDSDSDSDSDERGMSLRDKFLKRDTDSEKKDKQDRKKRKDRRVKTIEEEDEDEDDEDPGWIKVDRGTVEKPRMFEKDAEINHDIVVKKLLEIVAARGKKRTNRKEQIELLTELFNVSQENNLGIGMAIKVKFAIIAAIFDYNPKISEAMKPEYWEKCLPAVKELLDMLIEHREEVTTGENISDEQENLTIKPYKVRGCYLSVVERMCEDFIKVLKSCDAHSNEYVNRLKDEPQVIEALERAQTLVDKSQSSSEMCRIYLKRIEHLYFKFDPRVIQQKNGEIDAKEETSLQIMDRLCKYIYSKDATDRLRTHAILCHIYHHSIHDNWFEARDLMLMSHLQDTVSHADPMTQILYNRTMVQLGLCGFRHAEIKEAHNALLDIQMGGRSKELLAQGLLPQRHHERSSEQEKIEKQRQIPFHMHINLEMLECVYLVSAMLIEIPYMAAHEFDARRRMISKSYYQQLRSSERQALVGPPESMREHIVAASKAMRNGDWKKCKILIINEKMNTKVWDLFYEADKVREMLGRKIQEESLRTYLFTYSKVYDSISVESLASMFELEKAKVHAIVSKMIINEELMASLDEPTECMIMHRTEPTRLQSLSLQLADKIAQLVENNERLLELRPGGYQSNWRSGGKNDLDMNMMERDGGGVMNDNRDRHGGGKDRRYRNDNGGRRNKDGGRNKNYHNSNNSGSGGRSNNWKNKQNRE